MPGNLGSGVGPRLGATALAVGVLVALLWQHRSSSTPSLAGPPPRSSALRVTPAPRSPPEAAAPRYPTGGPRLSVASTVPAATAPPAAEPEAAYDPFARHDEEDPPARVLVAVGDLQLGVLTDARVRDEARLVALLTRIGSALEQLRLAPDQTPAAARQQLLEGYQEELGRYVDGEVELHGRDWNLGLEVGEVRPRPQPHEPGWRPRPD